MHAIWNLLAWVPTPTSMSMDRVLEMMPCTLRLPSMLDVLWGVDAPSSELSKVTTGGRDGWETPGWRSWSEVWPNTRAAEKRRIETTTSKKKKSCFASQIYMNDIKVLDIFWFTSEEVICHKLSNFHWFFVLLLAQPVTSKHIVEEHTVTSHVGFVPFYYWLSEYIGIWCCQFDWFCTNTTRLWYCSSLSIFLCMI